MASLVQGAPLARARPCLSAHGTRGTRPQRVVVRVAEFTAPQAEVAVEEAVDATLQQLASGIEQLKSSYEQPAAQAAASPAPAPEPAHPALAPAAAASGRNQLGEVQADGSVMFRDLPTMCGHLVSTQEDGTVTFHFD